MQKRPTDMVSSAVHVTRIESGEIKDSASRIDCGQWRMLRHWSRLPRETRFARFI